ncbi:MAG: PfkB family carbohydrate kinase [Acidobacteriota bacterium]|nr:PfkB family carbohydrate kinase [Acidobacteriota bacterium]
MRFPFKLSSEKPFDAVGFGTNAVDFLIVVPEHPQPDTKIRLTDYIQAAGGMTASAMVGLQRLGMKTAYAGRYGSDSMGEFGLKTLREENVNTDFCEVIENAATQIAFILIDEKTGERTVIWDRSEKLSYKAEEAPFKAARLARVLHTDAHDPAACSLMAQGAKEAGVVVSVDVDNVYEGIEELLPFVDVLISSSEFPHRLTGLADEKTALMEIQNRYGCQIVGKTKGVEGCLIRCQGEFLEASSYAVPGGCKDTTGAGDAFHAGFIYGLLADEEIETSLKIANAVAALKCRALGARTALPNKQELAQLLNQ